MRKLLLVSLLIAAPGLGVQQGRIDTGTNRGVIGVKIAVPEFQPAATDDKAAVLTSVFNKVLWDDLEYSGVLTLVSRSFYPLGQFDSSDDIRAEDWTVPAVDAQFVAFGSMRTNGGRIFVEARLWDLKNPLNREIRDASKLFNSEDTEEGARLIAHDFANAIVDAIGGGVRGIARTQIAYISDRTGGNSRELYLMDYDGHDSHALTNYGSSVGAPTWSPDGDKIAFHSRRRGGLEIEIVSRVDQRPFSFERAGGTTMTPSWSPDGGKIAFASSRDGSDTEIYVADWNGKNMRRLTVSKSAEFSPTWNPRTGQQIAFGSDRSGSAQIYIMDAEGTNVQRIIDEGGQASDPAWSPDGQRIAFAWRRARTSDFDIYVHELATGRNIQLTQNARDNEKPAWSPDGRHIAFESSRGGTTQIYSMLANGEKTRQLTQTGKNTAPAWSGYIN